MCGIAGYYLLDKKVRTTKVIEEMLSVINHRGPNDNGHAVFDTKQGVQTPHHDIDYTLDHDLALGNVRLSILDLSAAGHQPMYDEKKDICLVYNGEIFNYIELEEELSKKGHVFVSRTDTEVIIHAYQEYGIDCLQHFNGMWAFVLYDKKKNRLFCARDRFGVKPFYFYRDEYAFAFGSEIKALLCFPLPSVSINVQKIMRSVVQGYRSVDGHRETYYNEIKQLLPSEYLLIDLKTNTFTFDRYWRLEPSKAVAIDEEQAAQRFRELLTDAVRIRLRSDVPYAFTLSGGLDSASIVSIASKVLKKKTVTFSAIYEKGDVYDEQDYILPTLQDLVVDHHWVKPTRGDFFENLKRMIAYNDEPICTITFYSQWQVMKKIKEQGFTVVITGYAADELVAGYYDHYLYYFADLLRAGNTKLLEENLVAWQQNHGKQLKQWTDFQTNPDYRSMLAPHKKKYLPLFKQEYRVTFVEQDETSFSASLLTNRMYNELMFESVPAVLRPEDRNSMMFSLESRVPFLDYRLVEFCYGLPNELKIKHGLGKHVMREAMRGILNEKVRMRKEKVGFNAPFDKWLKHELKEDVDRLLQDPRARIYAFIDQLVLLDYWREHLRGTYNHMMLFWTVLNLEYWLCYVEEKGKTRAAFD